MNSSIGYWETLKYHIAYNLNRYHQYRRTTNETVIAETEYGPVKGVKRLTAYDVPYYSFEGIPFAQPPVGELRFKAPQRPVPWENVRDCTSPKDKCVQINIITQKIEGSEDCLYLNLYTNNLKPDKPRPVMVWIHGGGFTFGEASRDFYGPDYLVEKDVVLVCIQYRLGVLGFLSLDEPELNVPGNAGLKDQIMALRWIKNNCAKFGGNPDSITIFGESAGACSVHYLTITEQTRGLFHRAILMSGNSISEWGSLECTKHAVVLAKLAGYKGEENEKDVLQFLMKTRARNLIALQDQALSLEERQAKRLFAFGPVVEPYATPECVAPKSPREMMKTAWGNSLPILIGNTSYEGLLLLPLVKTMPIVLNETKTCEHFVSREVADDPELKAENGLKLKKAHVSGEIATPDEYLELYGYLYFYFPMHRYLLSRLAHAAAPTYVYSFDFDSNVIINPWRIWRLGRNVKGVSHTDDLTYLFWSMLAHRLPKDSREYRTIERMVGIWTQFAETGNPYNEKIPGMDTLTWEPIKKTEPVHKCLNISDDLKVIDLPETEKLKAWESTFDKKRELLY